MGKIRENVAVKREKAILVGALSQNTYADNLAELAALAESAGAIIVDKLQQKINRVHPATYIGSGKAEMVRQASRC